MTNNQVGENQELSSESTESQAAPDLSVARKAFRNSVGFQISFILYSGLEPRTAVDHICSAADRLLTATSDCGVHALGEAIAQAATKVGIIDGRSALTGPQLIMLCDDLARVALVNTQPTSDTRGDE